MARAVQANARQLLLAAHRRGLTAAPRIESPGAVRERRDALIDWRTIKAYSDHDLLLRTHQVWGQHCLFCWAFYGLDPHDPPPFGGLAPEHQMRFGRELRAKLDRLVSEMKALRDESSRRSGSDPGATAPAASGSNAPAAAVPLPVLSERDAAARPKENGIGSELRDLSDVELLARTCEYAGMLAAARWMADTAWNWADPEIMNPDARRAEPTD